MENSVQNSTVSQLNAKLSTSIKAASVSQSISNSKGNRFDLLPAKAILKIMECNDKCGVTNINDAKTSITNILNYSLNCLFKYMDGNVDKDWLVIIGKGLVMATGIAEGVKNNYSTNETSYITYGISKIASCFASDAQVNGERNWENGVLMHDIVDDVLGQILKAIANVTDEKVNFDNTIDALKGAAWKVLCGIWMESYNEKQQDIPMRQNKTETVAG